MVEKEEFEGEESFRCEVCGFHYKEREMAETARSTAWKTTAATPKSL